MKHEGKIILYSYDNINLFHKHSQIFITTEKSFNSVGVNVKQTWKAWLKGSTLQECFRLIRISGLDVVEAFCLAVFYGLLLNPGKTIINLIIYVFYNLHNWIKGASRALQPYDSD